MISPNSIIGALVYRTRQALGSDPHFLEALSSYYYASNCLVDGKFLLWHFPGTQPEISSVLLKLGQHPNGGRLKFPSVLNFQSIRQNKKGLDTTIYFNLAIVGSVLREWTTQTREIEVFVKVLRPIYEEFMRQVVSCGYFRIGYGNPSHQYYEVFTTGGNQSKIMSMYGDHIDAIEIHDLELTLASNLCDRDFRQIEQDNQKVTENIGEILK